MDVLGGREGAPDDEEAAEDEDAEDGGQEAHGATEMEFEVMLTS